MRHSLLFAALAMPLLSLTAGGVAAGSGGILDLTKPIVVELDREGRVVWSKSGDAQYFAIDADRSGHRVVTDSRHRITSYGANGRILFENEIDTPVDVDILDNGNYLVTSGGREGQVSEVTATGEIVWSYAGLERPRDADRLGNGNTLICDTYRDRVIEVDRDGKTVWSFDLGLKHPWDAEVYGGDLVVIADYDHDAVALVGRDLRYRWRINQLQHPNGVQVLPDGTILISESDDGVLRRVDDRGRTLGIWPFVPRIEDLLLTEDHHLLLAFSPAPESPAEFRPPTPFSSILEPMTAPGIQQSGAGPRWVAPAGLGTVILVVLYCAIHFRSTRSRGWIFWRIVAPAAVILVLGTLALGNRSVIRRLLPGDDTAGKNLVLILFDSLRHDHVPFNGYERNTTPRVMELIDTSVVFDQYITHAPWTKPSVASLLTSTYPSTHGVVEEGAGSRLTSSLTTIAEVLSENGYFSAAVMENPNMKLEGFGQGFVRYDLYLEQKYGEELPALTANAALKILAERPRDRPFFLMLFFMNPHYPYELNGDLHFQLGSGGYRKIDRYDSEIFEADAQVGRILDAIREAGLVDETIVVFSSDHGESMGEHGESFHGETLYDATLKVPLLIHGLGQSGTVRGLVREIDLMPTLLDYLGVEIPRECSNQMRGVSLRKTIRSLSATTGLVALAETRYKAVDRTAERNEHRKTIVDWLTRRVELYDLRLDPQELNDLVAIERARLLRWRMEQWPVATEAETDGESRDMFEELQAVGYLYHGARPVPTVADN